LFQKVRRYLMCSFRRCVQPAGLIHCSGPAFSGAPSQSTSRSQASVQSVWNNNRSPVDGERNELTQRPPYGKKSVSAGGTPPNPAPPGFFRAIGKPARSKIAAFALSGLGLPLLSLGTLQLSAGHAPFMLFPETTRKKRLKTKTKCL